jgi:hypothetical protein
MMIAVVTIGIPLACVAIALFIVRDAIRNIIRWR